MSVNKKTYIIVLLVIIVLSLPTYTNASDGTGDLFRIDVNSEHGTILNTSTGMPFENGPTEVPVELLFVANSGHEFVKWEIIGDYEATQNGVLLQITRLGSNISITAVTRNYSTSQELLTVVDSYGTPVPGDTLVNAWSFVSSELKRVGSAWEGMPCTPLIVEDKVYIRAAGVLYALDIHSGTIIKQVQSGSQVSYYHYISYGNGVIFDTQGHKAYDLDLNYLYDIPTKLVYASYHQGFFYGCLSSTDRYYTLFKTSIEVNKDLSNGVKINLFKDTTQYMIFAQYGQFSNVIFENGFFFFLQADRITGTQGYRAITAVNLETEKSDTKELTGFTGMPWDDGWLSYYNGYFYLTAYTAGLFDGVIKGLEDKRSSIMWTKFDFDSGKFEEPQYEDIKTPEGYTFRGIASGLEIYEGRGYINVRALGTDTLGGSDDTGTCMIAFNIQADGRPIPTGTAPRPMTHGGIVVNTAYDSEGKRYIYLLPYNQGSQGLYVFTDELIDGVWTLNNKSAYMAFDSSMNEYCSQAVRMGPNGELLFYLDSGYIQCYIAADRYPFTITTINNGSAEINRVTGKDLSSVLEKLYPGCHTENGTLTVGNTTYQIYGLNEIFWSYEILTDLSFNNKYSGEISFGITRAPYSQIALVETGCEPYFSTKGDSGWYFVGDSGVEKCNLCNRASLDNAVGCTLIYSTAKLTSDSLFMKSYLTVMRESTISLELPSQFDSSYAVNNESVIKVMKDGDTLTITGLAEDTATLSLTVGGKTNNIKVDVLPKVSVVDGKTVTESERTRDLDGGGTSTTIYTKTDDGTITSTVTTQTEKDSEGNTVRVTETTEETDLKGVTSEGQIGTVTTKNEKVTESGTVVSDRRYESESSTVTLDGTVTRTTTYDAVLDNLTQITTVTKTVSTAYSSFVEYESTSTTYDSNNSELSNTSDHSYTSKTDAVDLDRTNDSLTVTVKDGSTDLSEILNRASEDASITSISVDAGSSLNGSSVGAAGKAGADINMNTSNAEIVLNSNALNRLSGEGDLTFAVTDNVVLSSKQRSSAGDAKIFSVTLKYGDEEQHDFGKFSMTIACGIETQTDKELKVWRIDSDGSKTYADNVTYSEGKVRFTADHLSVYAVGYDSDPVEEKDSSDNTMVYVAIAAIAILVLVVLAVGLLRRSHKG